MLRKEKITWIFVAILFLGSALLVRTVMRHSGVSLWSGWSSVDANLRLNSDYVRDVKSIVDYYLTQRLAYSQEPQGKMAEKWRALAVEAKKQLLNLKVPSKKMEQHLNVVLTLERIGTALASGDLPGARSAEVELVKLFSQI